MLFPLLPTVFMRAILKKSGVFAIYSLAILLVLEVVVRLLGFQTAVRGNNFSGPDTIEHHPVLGWQQVPGSYDFPRFHPTGESVQTTILQNRSRLTRSPETIVGSERILFIGGSYTQGWAVNDHDTFVWKLQQQNMQFDMQNFGVVGYGSYQALLQLKSELMKANSPKHVVYGYIFHHKYRNLAEPGWLDQLYYGSNSDVSVPYASLDEHGYLEHHMATGRPAFPLSERLVTANMGKRIVTQAIKELKKEYATKTTWAIMKEMNELCKNAGAVFHVAILNDSDDQIIEHINFLDEHGIAYINCNVKLTASNIVKGDGHPDASVHDLWAELIGEEFRSKGIFNAED